MGTQVFMKVADLFNAGLKMQKFTEVMPADDQFSEKRIDLLQVWFPYSTGTGKTSYQRVCFTLYDENRMVEADFNHYGNLRAFLEPILKELQIPYNLSS